MVPGPSVRSVVRTDGIQSRFHQWKISHISDKDLHNYKIVNHTWPGDPLCTSSSQLLVQVACWKKAIRSIFSPSHAHITWTHLLSIFSPHYYLPELSPVFPNVLTTYTVFLSQSLALAPFPRKTWPAPFSTILLWCVSLRPGSTGGTFCPTAPMGPSRPLLGTGLRTRTGHVLLLVRAGLHWTDPSVNTNRQGFEQGAEFYRKDC